MTTKKDLRRRETDKLGEWIQQAALDDANKRIAELESALKLATEIALSWIHDQLDGTSIYKESLQELQPAIDLLPPPAAAKEGE